MSLYRYGPEVSEILKKKIQIIIILVILCFVLLWMRVWYLQILQGKNFIELSESNRIRLVSLPGYRGMIKDRNGKTMVTIRPSFNLYITPEDTKDLTETFALLGEKIDFDAEKVKESIQNAQPFRNVLIKADISRPQVAFIEENKLRLPGVHLKVEPLRNYVNGEFASHVLGYLGEISKTKLEDLPDYRMGDLVGKNGIEKIYESSLKGEKGFKEVEVDASGRELKILRRLPPKSGNNLILTLDAKVQKALEEIMTGTPGNPIAGSVVAMKVETGEIIAMVSKPAFDGNLFASGISRKNWRKLILDGAHPLQNRTLDGQYPPGSTYKIVTALAGLEEKVINPDTVINCPGFFRLGRGKYRCWKKWGHGPMKLHNALVQSCDVYFYTVGHRLGIDTLAKYARKLGLGDYTGIELQGEKPGIVPSTQWKLMIKGQPWILGETISASIGQGFNLVTPIQQANMVGTVANGGKLMKPYLVKRIENSEGKILREFEPQKLREVTFKPENLNLIREALLGVVNERRGTGGRSRLKNIKVSGKTGTAQVARLSATEGVKDKDDIPYNLRDHAWFVAFAPYEKPEIAVSVIVEHGGHGGATAAPIAKKVLQTYFEIYPPEIPPEEESIAEPTG